MNPPPFNHAPTAQGASLEAAAKAAIAAYTRRHGCPPTTLGVYADGDIPAALCGLPVVWLGNASRPFKTVTVCAVVMAEPVQGRLL